MKQFSLPLLVLAIAAFSVGPALAKGGHHSGGHHSGGAHHSSGHAHSSGSHAHKSNSGHAAHAAKAPKPNHAMKSQPKAAKSQPKAANSQPKAANSQPKAANSQPKTAKAQPKVTNTQPKTAKTQPKVTNTQPKTTKPLLNTQQQAKMANVRHHVSKTASSARNGTTIHAQPKNSSTTSVTPATRTTTTTPRTTHATTVSHRGSYHHRGYGRRHYSRNRRNYARTGRPSFTAGPDQAVGANSGPQTVAPWATRIRAGSSRQMAGGLQFQVTNNSNPALFRAPPSVSPTGTLSFTPAPGQTGTATVTLVLRSGTATSMPRTFHITVGPA